MGQFDRNRTLPRSILFRVVKLDPSVYYLDAVPIDLTVFSIVLLNIGTLTAAMLMMLGPSYLITKIHPAKSIRFE